MKPLLGLLLAIWLTKFSNYTEGKSIPCNGDTTVVITTAPASYFKPYRCVTYEPIEFSASPSQQEVYRKQLNLKEGGGTLQDLDNSIREDWSK